MKRTRIILSFFLLSLLALASPRATHAQAIPPVLADVRADYVFGETISFQALIERGYPVDTIDVFFQSANGLSTVVERAEYDPDSGDFSYVHDVTRTPIKAFTTIDFWFRFTMPDGTVHTSVTYSFEYIDNRFNWQELSRDPLTVRWYEGDVAFAQNILDAAQLSIQQMQTLLPAPIPDHLDIYVYANVEDYQFMQGLLGPQWAGGHADPDLGLVFVSLQPVSAPEQRVQVEREVPHEIAHIMLYQATGEGFYQLPIWLNEGIASIMELRANPDYLFLLQDANSENRLLPFESLCESFPRDASNALLSYAQSASFVRYLRDAYGSAGIRAIVAEYANGAGCERGTLAAPVNKALPQLERDWQLSVLNQNPVANAVSTLGVWAFVSGFLCTGPILLVVFAWRKRGNG